MKGRGLLALIAAVVLFSSLTVPAAWAQSRPAPAVVEVQIHSGDSIKSVLERMKDQEVTLTLAGGGEMTGRVSKVEALVVHLSRLRGKEFFDAVVRLDAINAVTVRARTN